MKNKKVKYRIKIETYSNGDNVYYAQKKFLFGWLYLCHDGSETSFVIACYDRNKAINRIDLNYQKNYKVANKIINIGFEYITKP